MGLGKGGGGGGGYMLAHSPILSYVKFHERLQSNSMLRLTQDGRGGMESAG